jgi:hypothetical protein
MLAAPNTALGKRYSSTTQLDEKVDSTRVTEAIPSQTSDARSSIGLSSGAVDWPWPSAPAAEIEFALITWVSNRHKHIVHVGQI